MAKQTISVALLTDTTMINKIIKSALDPELYDVTTFKSADDGFYDQIVAAAPDLIFIKTELNQANGIEVCDKIKQDDALKATKVVFLSSNHNIREQAIQHRADRFLILPFKPKDVEVLAEGLVERQKTILYVDDSDLFHQLVTPALKEAGFRVVEAWDGREGIEVLDEEGPGGIDLILSDVEMPEMDGLAFCQNVRKTSEEDIPFILASSLETEEAVSRGFEVGADDYIVKPIVIPELLSRIQRLLSCGQEEVSRNERILVVDDSEIVRNVIVKSLQAHGFTIDEAGHGVEAMAKLSSNRYHLMITDYEMPHMNGVDLCLKVREDKGALGKIPIIFATSRDSKTDIVKISSIGIQAFVAKPFDADRIVAETERVLAEINLETQRRHYNQFFHNAEVSRQVDSVTNEENISGDQFRTILYAGINGFQELCRNIPSAEMVAMLNRYFDCMADVLEPFDALIDKFNEDRIFTSFGNQEDGAKRAVDAAKAMIQAVAGLNKKNKTKIAIQIGIHSGHVILGKLGAKPLGRRFTLIGENINNAHLLKNMAKANEIVISQSTSDLLGDKIKATALNKNIKIGEKGRTEDVYRLG